MTEPRPPTYLVALCEGRACVLVNTRETPEVEAAGEAEALAVLEAVAARLRERGAIGRVLLLKARSKRVVARRRVWP